MGNTKLPHHKHEFLTVAGITTFVVVFLSLLFVLILPALTKKDPADSTTQLPTNGHTLSESIEVPFQYSVDRFEGDTIVLLGNNGEMEIPHNADLVRVYRGTPASAKEVGLSGLAVGNEIVLKMVHGEAAWLYIVN